MEPLGLELIGASVKGLHEVRLVDLEVAPDDLEKVITEFQPDILGVTSEIVHRNSALVVVKKIKEKFPKCLTVVGGHHPTMCPEDFSFPFVDLICIGEGVETFREICSLVEVKNYNFSNIRGLAIPSGPNSVTFTPKRPQPLDMNSYPYPNRELTKKYRNKYFYLFEKSVAAIRTSFGCTHHCTFCSVRVYSNGKFIPRSAELVFDEIKSIKEDFIMFCDDHSFIDPERMRTLAELLLKNNIKKRYFAYARTDSIVKHKDVYALWAKAGLSLVMSGLEAIDETALKRAGKQTSADINEKAVQIAAELGFHISAGFLVEPDFTREDFEKIDKYVSTRPSILLTEYTPLTPFPGTPLHRQIKEKLLTENPALFDLQHLVLPTKLKPKELYSLQFEYYGRSVKRVIKYLFWNNTRVLFSSHTLKLLLGIFQNSLIYKRAHTHIEPLKESCNENHNSSNTPYFQNLELNNANPINIKLNYMGWSGFSLKSKSSSILPTILIDPPSDIRLEDQPYLFLITHGHPEHLIGACAYLKKLRKNPVTVIASKKVCGYLRRKTANALDEFIESGDKLELNIGGWNINVFKWTHMSLLPEGIGNKAWYLYKLLSHPVGVLKILINSFGVPIYDNMFGYRISENTSQQIIYYGEGLHRKTESKEISASIGKGKSNVLITAIEPEDLDSILASVTKANIDTIIAFEAHKNWRTDFSLPQLDHELLRSAFSGSGVSLCLAKPGAVLEL
ncbi:MAG: cobalamin-dependent protein [Oligoflexia bacterium]|nr:cobalamin-dependent protein [Oligoflexia bacterium]